jgi:DNA uptake protein ComE-like DNA-binding protein
MEECFMFLVVLLLAAIVWLLWTLHQDMLEANQRQRNIKMELIRLVERMEKILESHEAASSLPAATVGLNSATKPAIQTLPKVGAVLADRIISARPFASIEQLRAIDGINDNLFELLRERVSLD